MTGDVGNHQPQSAVRLQQEIVVVAADILGRYADPSQPHAGDLWHAGRQQAELDGFGDFHLALLLTGGNQALGLLDIAPGDADLAGHAAEQFDELFGKDPFGGA